MENSGNQFIGVQSSVDSSIPSTTPPPVFLNESSGLSSSSSPIAQPMETPREDNDFEPTKNHSYNFFNQFRAVFLKSVAYQKRQYKTNLFQALVPVLMISIMSLVQLATPPDSFQDNTDPVSMPPVFVPPPLFNFTVPYILDGDFASQLGQCCQPPFTESGFLNLITTGNQLQVPPNSSYPTLGMFPVESFVFTQYSDQGMLDDIAYQQSKQKIGEFLMGFLFNNVQLDPDNNVFQTDIVALSNNTLSSSAIVNLLNNALYKYYLKDPTATLTTNIKEFPFLAYNEKKDMIQPQENFWYLFMMSFCMVVFVANVVYEKENRLRESMKMAGLRMRIYWLVQYIFNFSLYMLIVFVAIAFAYILKFRFFTQTEFTVYFVLFVLFGLTQIAFSFFISVFFSSVYTSTVVSFIYIIFTALSSNLLNNAFIQNPDTSVATFIITALIPHVAFHRAVSYISLEYIGNAPGLTWHKIFSHHQMPSLYALLFGEFLLFGLLHQYLELVIPSSYGVKLHPLFFLTKSFWVEKDIVEKPKAQAKNEKSGLWTRVKNYIQNIDGKPDVSAVHSSSVGIEMLPFDVMEERNYTFSQENSSLIKVFGLTKDFVVNSKKLRAVDGLTVSVDRGQCVGIIGPNAAGKTTSLSVLCGLYSPSYGTASIDGHDIRSSLLLAQQSLGVLPQYEILWSEMSGREHLQFYGRMKNINGEALRKVVDRALDEVMLTEAQDKSVRSYSGGMKRRLSLAISLIGSPSAVLLDEVSSGVDPYSRRVIWDVINSYKSKCAILMVTHNMEEAEILCDKVAILNKGSMVCIGRIPDLKTRYGAGYTLSVTTTSRDSDIHSFITELIPQSQLLHEISLNKTYSIPTESTMKLSSIFKGIQENRERYSISDWGITKSGLEDVLIRSTKERSNSSAHSSH